MTAQSLTTPWWLGAVIYQIYPRSFADSNGDGVGDLNGITRHMEHVASLGVDAIWLSPFYRSPMADFGYDVSDYLEVDPIFGTLADFDALVARAHELGLKVIIDQVYAHTSNQHPWFQESRKSRDGEKADWYVWADAKKDGTAPDNWLSVFYGPAWSWDGQRGQYYLHNFLPAQPNLNVHNPAVQKALLDVARFWLARGVDGFRLDAINFAMHDQSLTDNPAIRKTTARPRRPFDYQHHIHNQSQPELDGFIEKLAAVMASFPGERFTVAEVGGEQALVEMKRLTAGQGRLNTSYGFDFLYADKLTPRLITTAMNNWSQDEEDAWPSWAFSNHDAPRAVSRWGEPAHQDGWARLLLALLISLRGNIFLYQGEELGLPQAAIPFDKLRDPEAIANWPLTLGRDGARTPMPWNSKKPLGGFSPDLIAGAEPWLPMPDEHRALAVAVQNADAGSVLAEARALVALRRKHLALRLGDFVALRSKSPLLRFDRIHGDQTIRCLFNLSVTPVSIPALKGKILHARGTETRGQLAPLGFCLLTPD
jgi:alpha-glucosidase